MDTNLIKKQTEKLIFLSKNKKFNEAIILCNELINENVRNPLIYNIKGMIQLNTGKYKDSLDQFNEAIKLSPNNFEIYNNIGISLYYLGKFNEAIKNYNKSLSIKLDYAECYYNTGNAYVELGEFDKAIINFEKAIKYKPNYLDAQNNIIQSLTFHNPKNENENAFIKANNELQDLKFHFDPNKKITQENIKLYFEKCFYILKKNVDFFKFNFSQIYRRNKIDLNCGRHFAVFNTFNVIPEYCFGCYKVLIEPKKIIDLIKLYFVFDNINLNKSNLRKCMIEMRPNTPGIYKGFIYCTSLEDANSINSYIAPILKNTIDEKIKITVKRGCSEFAESIPEFKAVDDNSKFIMKYNDNWKNKEKIIDDKLHNINNSNERVLAQTMTGQTLNDILIINNWLTYAKAINDNSCNNTITENSESEFIYNKISSHLNERRKEFLNLNS